MDIDNPRDKIYIVERILKKRRHPTTKQILYYVKWKNFPNSENTWEPAHHFSQKLIDIYESKHSKKRKVSHNLGGSSSNSKSHSKQQQPTTAKDTEASQSIKAQVKEQEEQMIVYEPNLTKEIMVTDVVAKNQAVTISECITPEGFFICM